MHTNVCIFYLLKKEKNDATKQMEANVVQFFKTRIQGHLLYAHRFCVHLDFFFFAIYY